MNPHTMRGGRVEVEVHTVHDNERIEYTGMYICRCGMSVLICAEKP